MSKWLNMYGFFTKMYFNLEIVKLKLRLAKKQGFQIYSMELFS